MANEIITILLKDACNSIRYREFIVLDDAGELQNQTGDGWQIISIPRRFRSLPEKFNALAGLARGEILVVWEDDDIYLPHHISSHVAVMDGHLWSKPSKVLSDYTGEIQEEHATGRFHASIALTRQAFEKVAGWPLTMRGDFDQQLIASLSAVWPPADPCSVTEPSYVFRWESTAAYHGQALMRGPEDEEWYERARCIGTQSCRSYDGNRRRLDPHFDHQTSASVDTLKKAAFMNPPFLDAARP